MANEKDLIIKLKKDINKSNEKHIQQGRCEIAELKEGLWVKEKEIEIKKNAQQEKEKC